MWRSWTGGDCPERIVLPHDALDEQIGDVACQSLHSDVLVLSTPVSFELGFHQRTHLHLVVGKPSARVRSPAELANDGVPRVWADGVTKVELGPSVAVFGGHAKCL